MSSDAPQGSLTFTELLGGGLRLRAWHERDVADLVRGMNDPVSLHWNGGLHDPMDEDGALRYVRSRAEGWQRGDLAQFCVADAATDQVLGAVGLHQIELRRGVAGIGYWLMPEARGRGVVTRAVELCTRWGFEEVGVHRIELGHGLGNEASCAVALRTGYVLEGTARGALPSAEPGVHLDMHVHARLATDPAPERPRMASPVPQRPPMA
ncbi:GNAT family N-acetyltransferase [Streptomyces sp. NPDC058657]|uniref:GNAT family N-acetyltransferase n=1 Tax=unclassified Streptomyces TaxID=2593676 RepID=UPI00365E5770